MKPSFFCTIICLAISSAAFGGTDLSFLLSPSIETYPLGADPSFCETFGVSSTCVVFSGTLTDNDTDDSIINLPIDAITLSWANPLAATYFTQDSTYDSLVPGGLCGSSPDCTFFNTSYSGPLFGLDFNALTTPDGVYTGTATLSASGGTNDPNSNGFTQTASFTVVISPEPGSFLMMLAGLLILAPWLAARRSRSC